MKCGLKRNDAPRVEKKTTEVVKMAFEGRNMNKTSASVSRDKKVGGRGSLSTLVGALTDTSTSRNHSINTVLQSTSKSASFIYCLQRSRHDEISIKHRSEFNADNSA